ncbi:MAG: di-trans,poly-cis-decaprenylcistransferase [Chloroflexi bacterium]|nr:di-trans,poly-cis-decaprenylcistransferase [Chloroflexota bacterium]
MERPAYLPNHVAIIMDGNGRWAKQRKLPRLSGHKAGIDNMRPVIKCLNSHQVKYVTLYAFSTENWGRPRAEVTGLFRILEERIDQEAFELHKEGVKILHFGRLEEVPSSLRQAIVRVVRLTENNTGMTLGFAFNYGGRREILDAVRRIIAEGISPQSLDEETFNRYLYTSGIPDVDLLIRTGGEFRISNFMMWQSAYSEFYFTDVLWPDFNEKEVERALLSYSQRQRRFGGLQ